MLEAVRDFLGRGDRERARGALRALVHDLIKDSLVSGNPDPPLMSRAGMKLLEGLQPLAGDLLDDRARAPYVKDVIRTVRAGFDRKEGYDGLLFLANHVLQLVLPDFADVAATSIEDAKFQLGGAASDLDGLGFERFAFGQLGVAFHLVQEGMRAFNDNKLGRIDDLSLEDLDRPEGTVSGFPPIDAVEADDLVFTCPSCSGTLRAPRGRAGDGLSCPCGDEVRVPIPGLVRIAASLKARREAAMGVGRCRACNGVINRNRNGFMRAGFCGAVCARASSASLREHVIEHARLEGEDVVLACACGTALRVARDRIGSAVPCKSCGFKVWIPAPPEAAARRVGVVPCPKCGRKTKAAQPRCLYCGADL